MQDFRAQSCAYDNDVILPFTPLADFTPPYIITRLAAFVLSNYSTLMMVNDTFKYCSPNIRCYQAGHRLGLLLVQAGRSRSSPEL